MIDITLNNFESALIQASKLQPVLLDIWAPWCGPCRQLGPVLEQLETAYAGRFQLAKLNSDEVPQIAGQLSQAFGVRSIPFCVLFKDGQPVDGFVGAIAEADIRQFLDTHVAPAGPAADAVELESKDLPEAPEQVDPVEKLRADQAQTPDNDVLRCELIEALLQKNEVAQAQQLYSEVAHKGVLLHVRLRAVAHRLAALQAVLRPADELAAAVHNNPRDFEARFELAQTHFAAGRQTQAMDELLEILMRDKAWHNGLARETYVAILELMSPLLSKTPAPRNIPAAKGALEVIGTQAELAVTQDPVIEKYRRRLSMVIF
jgi:putative thioredoxin